MDFSADILLLYVDSGVSATHVPAAGGAATTAQAIHDAPGAALFGAEVSGTEHTLRYPTGAFPALRRGDTFTIAGVVYKVRDPAKPLYDGGESIVALVPA